MTSDQWAILACDIDGQYCIADNWLAKQKSRFVYNFESQGLIGWAYYITCGISYLKGLIFNFFLMEKTYKKGCSWIA